MRELDAIAAVRRGLLRQGFDRAYSARVAEELEEHWLDLLEEGLRQGLPQAEAKARAAAALGSAETLVREFSMRLQSSAWLGRHQALGFGLLALIGTLLWWSALLTGAAAATGLLWAEKEGVTPPGLDHFAAAVDWIRGASYLAIPGAICWAARRWHCGWKGALWGCLVAAIHNAMHDFVVSGSPGSGTVTWAYTFSSANGPEWLVVIAPLAVWAICFAWNSRPDSGRAHEKVESL